tara:strand:- start:23474 stop:24970 length:1497 start_codon:yes stop_codon:yes gene_type:complete
MKVLTILLLSIGSAAFMSQSSSLREEAASAMQAHEQAIENQAKQEAELAELATSARAQAGVVRDSRIATQLAADEAAAALEAYLDWLNTPPPVDGRPGEDLDWAIRKRPTADQYDWLVEGGAFQSQRGLGTLTSGFGDAYRLSRASGDTNIVFAISGAAGVARVGGTWNQTGNAALAYPGDDKASATFIGLTDTSSLTLAFGSHSPQVMRTGDVMAFDLGLRGENDSFAIRANGGSDHVQLEGCWFLNAPGRPYEHVSYKSGIHIDKWDTLVIKDHQWRGETPGSPGIKFAEHPIAYLKSGRTSTLIQGCDMYGGNRTGFQKRPDAENQVLPTDRLMVRNNYCVNYGDNHLIGDGGAVYTVWCSSAATYIYDNTADNFRFQALVISGQDPSLNFPFLPSGNQHNEVHVSGNRFTPGPLTERSTASISSCDRVHLWGDNTFVGPVILDAEWNYNRNGTLNGATTIHAEVVPSWSLFKYDIALGQQRAFTQAEIEALLSN